MSGSAHLKVRISTTAAPDEVFATLRRLTSALPSSTKDFQSLGPPMVTIHPPRFRIRISRTSPRTLSVEWSGEVFPAPNTGSLIVARTNRVWAFWPFVLICLFSTYSLILYYRGVPYRGLSPLFGTSLVMAIVFLLAWYQGTQLRPAEKTEALQLLEILLARLPESSLLEGVNVDEGTLRQ